MAYGNPGSGSAYGANPGGNEDYFADAPESKGEERTTPKEADEEKEEGEGQTAVVPKYLLAGKEFKPGDEMVVKIVSIHGDKVEISYAHDEGEEKEGEGEAPPPGEEPEPKGDGEMQSMMY